MLKEIQVPTGDPNCPAHIRKAKHAAAEINRRVELDCNEGQSDQDENDDGDDGSSQPLESIAPLTPIAPAIPSSSPARHGGDVWNATGKKVGAAPKIGCISSSKEPPLKNKRKGADSDNDLLILVRAENETRREEVRSRFEEMMAMAELQRQRDDRRFEEMRLQAQLQRNRDELRFAEMRLQAKADRDLILTIMLANKVDSPEIAVPKKSITDSSTESQ
jgi:hypothetical protein